MHYTLCDMIADITQNGIEAGAAKVCVELTETEKTLTVYVRDNGKGISPETLKKVQDPFYTDGVKHPNRKVGLGIPFLIQTISETGGTWNISSEPGKGTTVYMQFDLTNIDTPPVGDVPGLFRQVLLLQNTVPGYEMEISRKKETPSETLDYSILRSELVDALGDLENGKSLALLGDFLNSQETAD